MFQLNNLTKSLVQSTAFGDIGYVILKRFIQAPSALKYYAKYFKGEKNLQLNNVNWNKNGNVSLIPPNSIVNTKKRF